MLSDCVPARWWQGSPVTDAELRSDGNAFTLMRWILASTVMFSHGWDLTQLWRGLDPSVPILGMPVSRLAVALFFSLSGYLVIGGLLRRGVPTFLVNRALRLLPGLWVMLLVVPVILWLLFSEMPARVFFTAPQTRDFVLLNGSLLGGGYLLPGIFTNIPTLGVNGSLWTIPHEVRCYLALAGLAAVGLAQPRNRLTGLILVAAVVHLVVPEAFMPDLAITRRLSFAFLLGVFAWLWRERIVLSWPIALAGVGAALLVPVHWQVQMSAMQIAFAYLLLVSAFRLPAAVRSASQKLPDYSYGIYIYAYPAQQVAVSFGVSDPLLNIVCGFALTLPFAAASWHFVEAPALAMKRKMLTIN